MRSIHFDRYGALDVLALRDTAPPVLSAAQVLVKVAAASVNPKDIFVRKGRFRVFTGKRFPMSTGYDASGIVVQG